MGATSIKVPSDELHICFEFDYVSQMAAFEVAVSVLHQIQTFIAHVCTEYTKCALVFWKSSGGRIKHDC